MNHSQRQIRTCLQSTISLCLLLLFSYTGKAQDCDLACNGTLELPVQLVINNSCQVSISTNTLVPDLASCPGPKQLSVRDAANNLIADNTDFVQFPVNGLVNELLSVTITDQNTGLVCVSIVQVVDNFPPSITSCSEITVSCLDDASPEALGFPTISDNCTDELNLDLDFVDNVSIRDCLSDTASIIFRDWVVSDENGLQASCTQQINVLRTGLMDIDFPDDITLPCDDPSADTERTGVPMLNGEPIMHQGQCGLNLSFEDDTTFICNTYMYQIERTWTVLENCTDFTSQETQTILISDDEGPAIVCPTPEQLVFTSDPTQCSATIALPPVSATDNCGTDITFAVSSSYGAVDFSAISGVLPGTHTVQYQATDECGNTSNCNTTLTVVDDLAPIAACDDQMLVSIPSGGYALLNAITFDEGSSDNCNNVYFRVRRNDTAACDLANGDDSNQSGYQEWFDERVVFCCSDISDGPVSVTLRVYEADPGDGPVDPSRETGSGDLAGHYTDCQSTVTLQDAVAPGFEYCPPAQTIFCGDEQEDLGIYGSPIVSDNCGFFFLDSTAVTTLADCGEGTITRTWTATDAYGQSSSCSQLITIVNNEMLQLDDIIWPEDIDLFECGSSTAIEDLPLESQEPTINFGGCGNIGINQTEATFNTVAGACFKVLRTWTVIDWCHYSTEDPDGPGRYVHTQIIKVIDNIDPTITCPEPVVTNVSPDCATAEVNIGLPIADDCSTQISYINDSPYADSNGADASGTYPVGETVIQFIANDGCNNNTSCTTTVTVADTEAPAIACILGLTATLMNDGNGGGMAMMEAEALVASALDNCTSTPLLKFTISRPGDGTNGLPTATTVNFDCADANMAAEVTIWATDLENNTSSCSTVVIVQDLNDHCQEENIETGMIAGGVLTEDGLEVEDVMIMVSGDDPDMMYTDLDGSFMFDALIIGGDYSVIAENNEGLLNGVTTFDLVLMSKHVLGTQVLDSPYKMIAADIDRSGHISTLDIIKLRKLILNISTELPNNNKSWRFIDASYVFPDPSNPFLTYFPEIYNVNNLDGEEMHADFVGVKVGDVNNSAAPNSFIGGGERASDYPLVIALNNQTVEADETIEIDFTADYMEEWMGYQFTLEYDPTALEIVEIVSGNLPNVYPEENFHHFDREAGLLTTIWNEYDEQAQQAKSTLFTLKCRVKKAGQLKDWFYLSSRVTNAEAYTQDGTAENINLSFNETVVTAATNFELFQNRPNPWTNSTIIPFQLDVAGDANLSIYDMAGKLVYQVHESFTEGYHEISISRDNLPAAGLFYYTLEAGEMRATRKMVLN